MPRGRAEPIIDHARQRSARDCRRSGRLRLAPEGRQLSRWSASTARCAPVTEEKRLDHEDLVDDGRVDHVAPTQRQKFKDAQEVDLAYSVAGLGRFRCNVFQQRGTIGMVLRVIPVAVTTIDELGLPPVLKKIADEERGLVLVTGTTG